MKLEIFKIGEVFLVDKKFIYITGGSYYGSYGRISNFWNWRVVNKDGTLGVEESGYGRLGERVDIDVYIKIKTKKNLI